MRIALLALIVGCGAEPSNDDAPLIDGGVEDGGTEEGCPVEVDEPAPPAEPASVIWSCPKGWREADGCSPWPKSGPLDCPSGEAHFPGTPGCEPIGTDCPLQQFGEVPSEYSAWDRIYVDAAAPPGGDGMTAETATSALHFGLNAALSRMDPTIVLVAKGEYITGAIPVRTDMAVVGACARDTIVRSSTTSFEPNAYFGGSLGLNARIENMTLQIEGYGLGVKPGDDLGLRGIQLEGASPIGIAAFSGGIVRAERVVVRGVAGRAGFEGIAFLSQGGNMALEQVIAEDADFGLVVQRNMAGDPGSMRVTGAHLTRNRMLGAQINQRGTLELMRSASTANTGAGIQVEEGGTLIASDLLIADNAYLVDLAPGNGLVIRGEGRVQRALFERNRRAAIQVIDGGSLILRDAILRDTRRQFTETGTVPDHDASDGGGYGIRVDDGGRVNVRRARIERSFVGGLVAVEPRAFLSATDVVVTDTGPGLSRYGGSALIVGRSATATITRARFDRSRGAGIEVTDGSIAMLRDVVVRDSVIDEFGTPSGLILLDGSRASLDRTRFEGSQLYGIAAQRRTRLDINDVSITGGVPLPDGTYGAGLVASRGSQVFGTRIAIDGNRAAGMFAGDDVKVELSHLRVRGTQAGISKVGSALGRAISFERGVTATIAGALIEDNLEIGVLLIESSLVLRDAAIVRTGALEGLGGRGLQPQKRSLAQLENVCLEDNTQVGMLASDADLVGRGVKVLGTKHSGCFTDRTCEAAGGIGLYAALGGRITLADFVLAGNVETGIVIAGTNSELALRGGEMDLIDGLVTGSMLGADVRDPAFDRTRISLRVTYTGNDNNGIESLTTPLPDTNTDGLY